MIVPIEIFDQILLAINDPLLTFKIAVAFRRTFVRDACIPSITQCSMDQASRKGRVDVLQWWKESGLECEWTYKSMDRASQNGHVDVLQWWKESGLECEWTYKSMDRASQNGHVEVLQ